MMKKKKQQQSQHKRYYYNEHDERQVQKILKNSKKKRLKKSAKILLVSIALGLIILFFASPYSRIQEIQVIGNDYLDSQQVIDASGLSQEDFMIFTSKSQVEKKLKASGMIEDVKVTKGLFKGVNLEITEQRPIAYEWDDTTLGVVDKQGIYVTINASHLQRLIGLPRLVGFEHDERFNSFCTQFSSIKDSVRSMMSDITYAPEDPYDMERIRIDTNDGKIIYARIDEMLEGLKYYHEIINSEPDGCIYDINGNKAYIEVCPSE